MGGRVWGDLVSVYFISCHRVWQFGFYLMKEKDLRKADM
jgi:hypothetical protein